MNEALILLWKKVLSISPPTTNKELWEVCFFIAFTTGKVVKILGARLYTRNHK